jgi:hypothetical protein
MGTKASEQSLSAAGAATLDSDDGSGVCQAESDGGVTVSRPLATSGPDAPQRARVVASAYVLDAPALRRASRLGLMNVTFVFSTCTGS